MVDEIDDFILRMIRGNDVRIAADLRRIEDVRIKGVAREHRYVARFDGIKGDLFPPDDMKLGKAQPLCSAHRGEGAERRGGKGRIRRNEKCVCPARRQMRCNARLLEKRNKH